MEHDHRRVMLFLTVSGSLHLVRLLKNVSSVNHVDVHQLSVTSGNLPLPATNFPAMLIFRGAVRELSMNVRN